MRDVGSAARARSGTGAAMAVAAKDRTTISDTSAFNRERRRAAAPPCGRAAGGMWREIPGHAQQYTGRGGDFLYSAVGRADAGTGGGTANREHTLLMRKVRPARQARGARGGVQG